MKIIEQEPLKKHSYIGIGGPARYFVYIESIEDLVNAIKFAKNSNLPYFILGDGSNLLFPDEEYHGVIICTKKMSNFKIEKNMVICEAGIKMPQLAIHLQKMGLSGFEELCEIPGTVGGAVAGNAGAFGREIADLFVEGLILTSNMELIRVKREDLDFSYRKSKLKDLGILLEATFKLTPSDPQKIHERMAEVKSIRREKQPVGEKTLGSVFKNPPHISAGYLLDQVGLKGYRIGGAKYSEKHANFIVNFDNATSNDVKVLIEEGKKRVYEVFRINLEPEIVILNPWDSFGRREYGLR